AGADFGRRGAHVQPRVLRAVNREPDLRAAAEDAEPPRLRHLDDHLGRAVAARPELDARLLDEPLGGLTVERLELDRRLGEPCDGLDAALPPRQVAVARAGPGRRARLG